MDFEDLKEWIITHEGLELLPYTDTVGKTTIGVGRNLSDNGISYLEADYLLENDLIRVKRELKVYEWYLKQPAGVKAALINMCFNLGLTKLLTFKRMISALEQKNYLQASIEALNSKWARQVGQRAKDVALMIRRGE